MWAGALGLAPQIAAEEVFRKDGRIGGELRASRQNLSTNHCTPCGRWVGYKGIVASAKTSGIVVAGTDGPDLFPGPSRSGGHCSCDADELVIVGMCGDDVLI